MASTLLLIVVVVLWARLVGVTILGIIDVFGRHTSKAYCAATFSDVTIIIPAFNEENCILNALASIADAATRGATVVVVNDGSMDATAQIAKQFGRNLEGFVVIDLPENAGKPAALNAGLDLASTEFVLTLDADTRVEPNAIDFALSEISRRGECGRVTAAVAFDVGIDAHPSLFVELQGVEYDASLNFERRAQGVVNAISVCPGAASLWRRECLRRIGGFSENSVTEDVDATLRLSALGLRVAHHPRARAKTGAPRNWKQLMSQRRRWCLGHYQNLHLNFPSVEASPGFRWKTYPNFFFLNAFTPALLLGTLLVLIFEPKTLGRQTFLITNVMWLSTVYVQRAIALKAIGRRTRIASFVLEPFATALVHFFAFVEMIKFVGANSGGRDRAIWSDRAR